MKWFSIAVGCMGWLAACSKDAPPPPRGLLDANGRPLDGQPQRPEQPSEEQAKEEPAGEVDLGDPFKNDDEPGPAAASAEENTAPKLDEKKRDLEQELLAALPAPASCVDLAKVAASGGGKLTISVTAALLPSGHVSRASVSAPGQSADAVKCLEKGVLAAAIAPDVPGAPLAVHVSNTIEAVAQAKPQTKPQEQTAQAPGGYVYKPPPPPSGVEFARPEQGDVAKADGQDFAQPSQ